MRTLTCPFVAPFCALVLAVGFPVYGTPPTGILANQRKLKPVVSVANSYSEKVVKTFAGDAETGAIYEVQPGAEKVSVKATALLGDFDFSRIDGDMRVALTAGDFNFEASLGEAGAKTLQTSGSATFTFNYQVPQLDADGGAKVDANGNELFTAVKMGTLTWVWSAPAKRVTATLALVIPGGGLADTVGASGIASARFRSLGDAILEGGGRRFANRRIPVAMRFGTAEGSRDAFVGGVTRTRVVKMAGAAENFVTTSVVLAGGADTRGPQLAVRTPVKMKDFLVVPISATLVDRPVPTLDLSPTDEAGYLDPEVALYLDPPPGDLGVTTYGLDYTGMSGAPLPDGASGLDPRGVGYLSGETPVLSEGAHLLRLVATDSEGNMTVVDKNVLLDGYGMVEIPAGSYTRGNVIMDVDGDVADAAVQTIFTSKFYIQSNLVTKAEWNSVQAWAVNHGYVGLPSGGGKADNHPVHSVSWHDVVKWANAASEKAGLIPCYRAEGAVYRTGVTDSVLCDWDCNGYRLPTELEWEKAARGGQSGVRFATGLFLSHEVANYQSSSGVSYDLTGGSPAYNPLYTVGGFPYTSPVGSFLPNGYQLHDMAGNLNQWCWDWYGASYIAQADTHGPGTGSSRVLRGGSWNSLAKFARCAYREATLPGFSSNQNGFRLARTRP